VFGVKRTRHPSALKEDAERIPLRLFYSNVWFKELKKVIKIICHVIEEGGRRASSVAVMATP
jgi:hypothetical protein